MSSIRFSIVAEVFAFIAFALVSKALVSAYTWKYAGPITLLTTLGILTLYLRWRGLSWQEFGLKPLLGWRTKLMVVPQALLVFVAFSLAVGSTLVLADVLELAFMQQVSEGVEARFGEVRGNLTKYLLWLGIVWVSAAFGEEMFFRGYLVTRLHQAINSQFWAPVLAVTIAASVFGYGHYEYQGLRGLVMTGLIGLAFGIMYLLLKRNLWPLILVHGVIDTLSFTGLYLDVES